MKRVVSVSVNWGSIPCLGMSLLLLSFLLAPSLVSAEPGSEGEALRKPAEVRLQVTSPLPGEVTRNRVTMAEVRGIARSGQEEENDFDVFILIDISHSTRYPSGLDIDEDGDTGFNPHQELIAPGTYPDEVVCSDPEDTILAAEVRAAKLLLTVLDSKYTQVGVIVFSGAVDPETGERLSPEQRDALVKVPLTQDFARVDTALDEVLEDGPQGATNFAAAVQLSVVELAGIGRAYSEPRPGARKVALFLTDGVPTFPFGKATVSDPEDIEAALAAARLAKTAGVTVNTFALGQHALASPLAPSELARITRGRFIPVRNPGDIVSFLQGISFADIDDVVITNHTTGDVSYDVELSPDGSSLRHRAGSSRPESHGSLGSGFGRRRSESIFRSGVREVGSDGSRVGARTRADQTSESGPDADDRETTHRRVPKAARASGGDRSRGRLRVALEVVQESGSRSASRICRRISFPPT